MISSDILVEDLPHLNHQPHVLDNPLLKRCEIEQLELSLSLGSLLEVELAGGQGQIGLELRVKDAPLKICRFIEGINREDQTTFLGGDLGNHVFAIPYLQRRKVIVADHQWLVERDHVLSSLVASFFCCSANIACSLRTWETPVGKDVKTRVKTGRKLNDLRVLLSQMAIFKASCK